VWSRLRLLIDLHVLDDDDVMMMTAWIEIWNGDVMIERVTMKHYYYYRGRRVEVVVVEMTSRRHGLCLFSSLWSG
jgi:hypothetical protein